MEEKDFNPDYILGNQRKWVFFHRNSENSFPTYFKNFNQVLKDIIK